jgi:hypothetical protein
LQPVPQQAVAHELERTKKEKDRKRVLAELGLISGAALVTLGGIIAIGYHWISTVPSILVPFVVGAALPLFTLFAIIYQAIVYNRQWRVMKNSLEQTGEIVVQTRAQLDEMKEQGRRFDEGLAIERAKTDPRLRVSVRAMNFNVDQMPIFVATVTNDGLIPVRDVIIQMVVEWDSDKTESSGDKFDVPSKESEAHFLPSHTTLDEAQLERFNNGTYLIVRGTLNYFPFQLKEGDPPQEFCFKY